jgi:glycosyltransferase involved in cell wall biosynthesis
MMSLTVAIISYNYGHLAAHCIETILSQNKQPDRILFVDDGAGDCSHLQKFYPEVEFLFRETNLGVVNNFQDVLMNRIKTEKCMFVGADNWLRSDAIQILIEPKTDINICDVIFTGINKTDRLSWHPNQTREYQGDYYWNRTDSHHGSMLYDVRLAREVGGYAKKDDNLTQTEEDWVLFDRMVNAGQLLLMFQKGCCTIEGIEKIISNMR